MLKQGTRCVDASICFSLKLCHAVVDVFAHPHCRTTNSCSFTTITVVTFSSSRQYVHVDDMKVSCEDYVYKEFVRVLEQVFGAGELDITHDNFTNCGTRHTKTPSGYELVQTEDMNTLKPIQHAELTSEPANALATTAVQQMLHWLVMAVAYTFITRIDLCIYCVALQRVTTLLKKLHQTI